MKIRILLTTQVALATATLSSQELLVDFNSTSQSGGPHPQTDYQAYNAAHEVPADFITRSFPAFGTSINITPAWPNTTDNRVRQMIDREDGNDANWNNAGGDLDLITDFLGIDTRPGNGGNGNWDGDAGGTPTYMTLTLGGLPAGTYGWTSFHHDTEHVHTNFEIEISTDGGTSYTSLGQEFYMSDSTPGGNPDSATDGAGGTRTGPDATTLDSTATFQIDASGTDDVVLRFAPLSGVLGSAVHNQIWGINGFQLSALNAAGLDDLTWTITDGEITITDCDESATGELVIPDTIGGNPVTSIRYEAFFDCTNLTSITIPDSVTSIGHRAFFGCLSLPSITIPDGVTSIGDDTFAHCYSLTSITIPDSVTSIGESTLAHCRSLTSVTIPDSVTSIGDGAFRRCTSLTSITIPAGVISIGNDTFYHCTSLTSITIPDSVTSIGPRAFSNCSSLTSITIPDSVTSIGYSAFSNCSSLQSVYFLGAPPIVEFAAFLDAAACAKAIVPTQFIEDFGGFGADWNSLTVSMSNSAVNDLSAQVATVEAERDAAIAERDAAIAERDARFTEDQIRAMSADYTIGLNEAGNVQMKISFFESSDLATFAPLTVTPESVSVVDGKICFEFAPTDDAAFFRFSVQ